jgi:hypothetical protein
MKRLLTSILLSVSLAILVPVFVVHAQPREEIRLTTIIPDQQVLRVKKGIISTTNYRQADFPDGNIPASCLFVEGNVGIGTTNPKVPAPNSQIGNLDVNDIYLRSTGKWMSQSGSAGYGAQNTNGTQTSLASNNVWYQAVKIPSFPCDGKDVLINATVSTLYQGYAVDYFIRLKIGGTVVVTNRFSQDYNEDPQLHVTWLAKSCSGTNDITIEVSKSGSSASINPTGYPAVVNAVRFPWSS